MSSRALPGRRGISPAMPMLNCLTDAKTMPTRVTTANRRGRTLLLLDVDCFRRIYVEHADENLRLGRNTDLRRNQAILGLHLIAVEVAIHIRILVHASAVERDSSNQPTSAREGIECRPQTNPGLS